MSLWVKDQNGNPSVIVTLVAVSFVATTAAYVLSMFDKVGSVSIRPFDATGAAAYFGIILSAFVGHHFVTSKYGDQADPPPPPQDSQPLPPTNG